MMLFSLGFLVGGGLVALIAWMIADYYRLARALDSKLNLYVEED